MNCLWHELCLSAHWLQFNSWRRRHADEKSWRSQFTMRQHQFIYKNEQSKNRRICFLLLLLFSACYMGLGLVQMHLTSQMRCSHLVEVSNSPLRTSRISLPFFKTNFLSVNNSVFEASIKKSFKCLAVARLVDVTFTLLSF